MTRSSFEGRPRVHAGMRCLSRPVAESDSAPFDSAQVRRFEIGFGSTPSGIPRRCHPVVALHRKARQATRATQPGRSSMDSRRHGGSDASIKVVGEVWSPPARWRRAAR